MKFFNSDSGYNKPVLSVHESTDEYYDIECVAETSHHIIYKATKKGQYFTLKSSKLQDDISLLLYEYDICKRIDSIFVVKSFGIVNIPQIGNAIEMEYINGCTLEEFLRERRPLNIRTKIFDELLEALDLVHSHQIVHADLKPSNILITKSGNHVKLIDFGYADAANYVVSNLGNTRVYAAPEQLKGEAVDVRADIYALGKIIDELFPYKYKTIKCKCLKTKPNRRFSSVAELRHALTSRHRFLSIIKWLCVLGVFCGSLLWMRSVSTAPVIEIQEPRMTEKELFDSILKTLMYPPDSLIYKPPKIDVKELIRKATAPKTKRYEYIEARPEEPLDTSFRFENTTYAQAELTVYHFQDYSYEHYDSIMEELHAIYVDFVLNSGIERCVNPQCKRSVTESYYEILRNVLVKYDIQRGCSVAERVIDAAERKYEDKIRRHCTRYKYGIKHVPLDSVIPADSLI